MPPLLALRPSRSRTRTHGRLGPRQVGELSAGLLLGVVGGWVAGLVRVRRP